MTAKEHMKVEKELEIYFDRLFPICRSITGEGYQKSLDIISEIIPLEKIDFPSGTDCCDWTVPDEWNIRDA
jgi:aminopeptidase-like protein